jgi:hypothetical protein
MKKTLPLLILTVLMAACGAEPAEPGPAASGGPSELQIVVVADDFAVGRPRLPIVLYDGPEPGADATAVRLTAFDLSGETPVEGWSGPAEGYGDYEVPYWVAYPELPAPGTWGFLASVTRANGSTVEAQFAVAVAESSQSPALGEAAPPSQNRTLATEPDISRLTSGSDPLPALYEMTVAEAIASGRPTVVTLATPAFCQTQICAPVVKSVEAVQATFGARANFIHLEIYQDFQELILADEVAEWGLTSEPWTFVLDETGRVAARLGGPVSPRELESALIPLLP